MATIRVPGSAGGSRRRQETRQFGTTRRDLLALAAWLREWQVERGMEATFASVFPSRNTAKTPEHLERSARKGPPSHGAAELAGEARVALWDLWPGKFDGRPATGAFPSCGLNCVQPRG